VLKNLHSQTYEIQIETIRQARLHGFNVKEIPITFVDRKRGESKLTVTEAQVFLTYTLKAALSRFTSVKGQVANIKPNCKLKKG